MIAPYVKEAGATNSDYVVVFASPKQCTRCPEMYPVIRELRRQKIRVFYVDTLEHEGVLEEFQLKAWPTTIVYLNGKEVVRIAGVTTAEKISSYLE